jgi:hypothetical protein
MNIVKFEFLAVIDDTLLKNMLARVQFSYMTIYTIYI